MDTLQVFEIVGGTAIERPALANAAVRLATTRYPCLHPGWVHPNGVRWTHDSRQIVLFTISASYACSEMTKRPGSWHSLWMIGDVTSGLIDPDSVRVQSDNQPMQIPQDDAYSRL